MKVEQSQVILLFISDILQTQNLFDQLSDAGSGEAVSLRMQSHFLVFNNYLFLHVLLSLPSLSLINSLTSGENRWRKLLYTFCVP